METFLKRSYKLMFKFDVYFQNIEVIDYFNSFGDMVSYRPPFKHKIIKKLHLTVQKGAGCCMYPCDVISSVA